MREQNKQIKPKVYKAKVQQQKLNGERLKKSEQNGLRMGPKSIKVDHDMPNFRPQRLAHFVRAAKFK